MILWKSKTERYLRCDGVWLTYSKQLRLEKWQLILTDHYDADEGRNYDADEGRNYDGRHLSIGFWKRFSFGYFDDYYDGRWQSLHIGCLYVGRYS